MILYFMEFNKNIENKVSIFEFEYGNTPYEIKIQGDNRRSKSFELLLTKYPEFLSVHDDIIKNLYDDPNKAINEFMHDEGFISFIEEKKINSDKGKKILSYKLKIPELTEFLSKGGILKNNNRKGLSKHLQIELVKKSQSKCQLTGYKLNRKKELDKKDHKFMNKLLIINFDHRVPLFKGGENDPNDLKNWMLISEYANQEKNKVCKVCYEIDCDNCALAFPENNLIIKPSQQNLKDYYIK